LHYTQRLGTGLTGFSASAVAGDGKIYCASEEGDVFVVKAGAEYELLGKNALAKKNGSAVQPSGLIDR